MFYHFRGAVKPRGQAISLSVGCVTKAGFALLQASAESGHLDVVHALNKAKLSAYMDECK